MCDNCDGGYSKDDCTYGDDDQQPAKPIPAVNPWDFLANLAEYLRAKHEAKQGFWRDAYTTFAGRHNYTLDRQDEQMAAEGIIREVSQ